MLQVRGTGEAVGIIYDDGEKRVDGAGATKTLGADFFAASQGARPLAKRRTEIADLTMFLLPCYVPAIKHIEMGTGVWIHIAQYKRQMRVCFKRVWVVIQALAEPAEVPALLAEDMLKALALLPLAKIRFNLDVDEMVPAASS